MDDSTRPLGAIWNGHKVDFAVGSAHAQAIDLCLFDSPDLPRESRRVPLQRGKENVWHAQVAGVQPGTVYGYRAHGPYEPQNGHRFNPYKLLVDPYARALCGRLHWHDAVHGYLVGSESEDASFDPRDSAPYVPRSVVRHDDFTWGGDLPPRTPWSRSVLYECHVKGLTTRHPRVPPELRGTYLGLASPPIVEHLLRLGVTAVELLPVHHALNSKHLAMRDMVNYWGYDTIGFFAPDPRFATRQGDPIREFQTLVRDLHRAGIEVILDVVYNHTVEGDQTGPTLCWRGLDNRSYYHLRAGCRREYENHTGCGNSLNASNPMGRRMILDSLRYWVQVMHVDGFRLDLATTLTRGADGEPNDHSFCAAIENDPVLSLVKFIAEPWDVGHGGYRIGQFPSTWCEWNDQYRDTVRRFWRGDDGQAAALATRFSGSSDIFPPPRRRSWCSLNFVTCHDGFTLRDLVTYETKHNVPNGEDNRDGANQNFSRHWGVEGETDCRDILLQRERIQRSLLATLGLSLGVPMFSGGDELDRTQFGNNNAYGQDNETSWVDWNVTPKAAALADFAGILLALRRRIMGDRDGAFFRGDRAGGSDHKDLTWLRPDGTEMTESDWGDPRRKSLAMWLHRAPTPLTRPGPANHPGDHWLILLNAHEHPQPFALPKPDPGGCWLRRLHTAYRRQRAHRLTQPTLSLRAHSMLLAEWKPGG